MDTDEHPKPDTTVEKLSKLPTVFKKDGTITAGSASVRCFMRKHINTIYAVTSQFS